MQPFCRQDQQKDLKVSSIFKKSKSYKDFHLSGGGKRDFFIS